MPLPYQPENNDIPVQMPACRGEDGAGRPPSVALDALRTLAVSRIYLDNPESFRGWRRWR